MSTLIVFMIRTFSPALILKEESSQLAQHSPLWSWIAYLVLFHMRAGLLLSGCGIKVPLYRLYHLHKPEST